MIIEPCKDYMPGEVMGTARPICKYYIRNPPDAAGACTSPEHFMCEYWTVAKKKGNNNETTNHAK